MENKKSNEEFLKNEFQNDNEPEDDKKNKFDMVKLILPGSILIAALLISGSVLYTKINRSDVAGNIARQVAGNEPSGGRIDVSVDDDPFLGDKNAPVTIIEFSDYQCPFCRRFWTDTLFQLKEEYIDTGKVRFVYRDFPLSFHPAAQISSEAAECAREQGKYWQMHDKIFEEQDKLGSGTIQFDITSLKKWAQELALNSKDFNNCLDSGKYKEEVQKDFADGSAAGTTGTPTFFINGRKLVGAQPFSAFKAIIDAELEK